MQRFANWNFDGTLIDEMFQKARDQAVFGTPTKVVNALEGYRERFGDKVLPRLH